MAKDLTAKLMLLFGIDEEKERQELRDKYPEGSQERKILEYSMASRHHEEVPGLLKGAFYVLMGITVLMSLAALIGFIYPSG